MSRILVVDDEEDIVELIAVNLQRKGYDTLTAYNGTAALEVARKERPDLILLDVMMPCQDGLTVLTRLRSDPATQATPIVIITARRETATIFSALARGATDVILKPFGMADMLKAVERYLSGGVLRIFYP